MEHKDKANDMDKKDIDLVESGIYDEISGGLRLIEVGDVCIGYCGS